MTREELATYVHTELQKGADQVKLIRSLLAAGWKVEDINSALNVSWASASPSRHLRAIVVILILIALVGTATFAYPIFSQDSVEQFVVNPGTPIESVGDSAPSTDSPPGELTKISALSPTPPDPDATPPATDNIWFTPLVGETVFLAKDDGTFNTGSVISPAVTKKFFEFYPDKYDFIAVITTYPNRWGSDYGYVVRNLTRGIGNLPEDVSAMYGSQGTLQGVAVIHDVLSERRIPVLIHEIAHSWLAYLPPISNRVLVEAYHWSNFLDMGTHKGGLLYLDPVGGGTYKDNGDGTFSNDPTPPVPNSSTLFHPFSLYLMGLLPASDVPHLTFWEANTLPVDTQAVQGAKTTITVQDVIKVVGPRIPAYPNAKREFKIAYILLPKKGQEPTSAHLEKVKWIAQNFPKEWSTVTSGHSSIALP